MQLERKEIAF